VIENDQGACPPQFPDVVGQAAEGARAENDLFCPRIGKRSDHRFFPPVPPLKRPRC
jgi:hypothetical protein